MPGAHGCKSVKEPCTPSHGYALSAAPPANSPTGGINTGEPVPFVKSPRVGKVLRPRFVVIHFTAGQSAEAAVSWLSRTSPGPSAHLVIGRDGSVTQLVPFDRIAFHAGPSPWGEIRGLDPHSFGIELDNAGPVRKIGGKWTSTFKRPYSSEDVLESPHKNGGPYRAWHKYTAGQIDAVVEVCKVLADNYPIVAILGHDDISPGRKWDPGPSFPIEDVNSRVFSHRQTAAPQLGLP